MFKLVIHERIYRPNSLCIHYVSYNRLNNLSRQEAINIKKCLVIYSSRMTKRVLNSYCPLGKRHIQLGHDD